MLKYSFLSKAPLTTLLMARNYIMRDELVERSVVVDGIDSFKKMAVNVLEQKSSNRILLALSSKDFIDLLLNLFNVPLGRAQVCCVNTELQHFV